MTSPPSSPEFARAAAVARDPAARSLRRSLGMATLLTVLYGAALPVMVLSRLLPQAQLLERESVNSSRAFTALRQQSEVVQRAAAQVRSLERETKTPADSQLAELSQLIRTLRDAPRAEYGDLAAPMRGAFATALANTDNFAAMLDETVRAYRLGDAQGGRTRITRAITFAQRLADALDETQRRGLDDLLRNQRRMSAVGRTLVMWTMVWLAIGVVLVLYLSRLALTRLLRPLDALEAGLTQLSAGDLEARVTESSDELGRLARVFNHASNVLRRRAEEQGRFAAAGQLLADVAHEVNNPLMAILGIADSRLDDPQINRETREDLALVRDQARRAGSLLSGLLRFVRAADEPANDVALASIVSRALDLVAYQFRQHGIECHNHTSPSTTHVRASATRIEQVLVNLFTNAVQAMHDSAGTRRIDVRITEGGGVASLVIRDTGPGVSPVMRERLFEPFASTKGDQGTGLGLYICRRIAREFGGELQHDDAHPGAQFTLTLPAVPEIVVPDADARTTHAAVSVANLRVLLVDDEDGVRRSIARYLRRAGAVVDEASNGEEALARLASEQPDVMLLDLRMPVLDGHGVLARLAVSMPWMLQRIIVLSGDLTAGHTIELPLPSECVLAKPIALQLLTTRMREVADRWRASSSAVRPTTAS